MSWFAVVRSGRHWRRFIVAIVLLPMTIVLSAIIPELVVPIMLLAVILLIWERMQLHYAMRNLATQIAAGELDTKLEVRDGAWGSLCHAVNNLLQEQRHQAYVQTLLPVLPAKAIAHTLKTRHATDGTRQSLTVLVVGYTTTIVGDTAITHEHLMSLRALSSVAQQQAEQHGALLERFGDLLLFAFGAFEEQALTKTLRNAVEAARELRQSWDNTSPRGPLAISLASGPAISVALPGIGYTVFGTPIDQALRLQQMAATCPEYALLCSEESYLTLRILDTTRWLPTDLRLVQPDHPPQVVYALPL